SPCWISDAAVLSTEDGESFARWFQRTDVGADWETLVDAIPVSRIYEIADEARRRSAAWLQFASAVEGRVRSFPARGTCR
ncbi:MAG: hypothetical protein J2P57_15510, partial [Acidimicrobiaceae bacterium]|nr:hypothetical protein [Acidimicrobiaceae bacterium]